MDRDRIEELVEELIDERSVEALERLTGSNNDRVLAALLDAAGQILDDDRSEESDDTIVEEIEAHLVKCAKTGPLLDGLEHKNPRVKEVALACLGEIGDVSTAEPMIDRLEDEDEGVREAALEHLSLLSDQDLGPDPAAWRKWLETVAEIEKVRQREEREELTEKRQKRKKVLADVDTGEASEEGDSDVEEDDGPSVRKAKSDDDDDRVPSRGREDDDDDGPF